MRRALTLTAAIAVAFAGVVAGPATPGSATTYYDYWSYWHKPPGATAWQYSKVGASGYYLLPDKPQVEGWRYAIGTASSSDPKPRPTDVTYDDYCAGHDTGATYRVLLVVDYGTQSGAPAGPVYSCYGFDSQPSGLTVLTKQHQERDSGGLICAIDSYPKSGCGEVVSSPAPKPTRSSTPTTPTHRPQTGSTSSGGSVAVVSTTTTAATTTKPRTSTKAGRSTPATTAETTTTPTPAESASIVAKQFDPPRSRGGVPFGFVAGCVLVVALVGAVLFQRRRRAG